MAITLTFDTVQESAAFFAMMSGAKIEFAKAGELESTTIVGQAAPAGGALVLIPGDATAPAANVAPAPVPAPAPAPGADGDKKPTAAQEAVAAAQAAAKAARKPKEKADPKVEPAPKPEPTASTSPTATAETAAGAPDASGGDFFGSTDQTAGVTDAAPAEPTYTYQEVHDGLRAWSGKVNRDTFAALMQECGVASVPALEHKPELFATIMKKITAE